MKHKIWIVRDTSGSIMSGGLNRLFVYFSEPTYFFKKRDYTYPLDVFDDDEINIERIEKSKRRFGVFIKAHWHITNNNGCQTTFRFSEMFGYDSEFSKKVWSELEKHFLNADFDEWEDLEDKGLVKIEDFKLSYELELKVKIE